MEQPGRCSEAAASSVSMHRPSSDRLIMAKRRNEGKTNIRDGDQSHRAAEGFYGDDAEVKRGEE